MTPRAPAPLPLLLQGSDRILVLAPHPDDESLPVGGLLRRGTGLGAGIRIVYATDGDNNPWAQRAVERRWRIGPDDRARWAERRRREAIDALRWLGVPGSAAAFMALPDQGLTGLLLAGDPGPVRALAEQIETWRPTLLAFPSPRDLHPDHNTLAVMSRFALETLPAVVRPATVLEYVVHGPPAAAEGENRRLDLTREEVEAKRRAILCHDSQLALRRRFMVGFARATEDYRVDRGPAMESCDHPVRAARWEGETLILKLASSGPGLGPLSLLIALGGNPRRCLQMTLPRRSREVDVRDPALGIPVTAAGCRILPGSKEITLDLGGAGDLRTIGLFVKADRPTLRGMGFFDRAGWRAVPAPVAEAGALPRRTRVPGYLGQNPANAPAVTRL